MTTTLEGGTKYDAGKEPIDLLDPDYLFGTARVLAFGAGKYSPYNWAEGMKWSRVFAALMRHMWKWWRGEDKDEETGESHLYHASCCLMFLARYEADKKGEDDRYLGYKKKKETDDKPAAGTITIIEPNTVVKRRLPNLQANLRSAVTDGTWKRGY